MTPADIVIRRLDPPLGAFDWPVTWKAIWEEDGRIQTLQAAKKENLVVCLRARFGSEVKIRYSPEDLE